MDDSERLRRLISERTDPQQKVRQETADGGKGEATQAFPAGASVGRAPRNTRLRRASAHSEDSGEITGIRNDTESFPGASGVIDTGSSSGDFERDPDSSEQGAVVKVFNPRSRRVKEVRESYDAAPEKESADEEEKSVVYDTKPLAGVAPDSLRSIADSAERDDGSSADDEDEQIQVLEQRREQKAREFAKNASIPDISAQARQDETERGVDHFRNGLFDEDETDGPAEPVGEKEIPEALPITDSPVSEENRRNHRENADMPSDGLFGSLFRNKEPVIRLDDEYRSTADNSGFTAMLSSKTLYYKNRSLILFAAAAVGLIFDTVVSLIIGSGRTVFGGNAFVVPIVNAVLLLFTALVERRTLASGVACLIERRYDVSVYSFVSVLLALLQLVAAFISPAAVEAPAHMYTPLATVCCALVCFARFRAAQNARVCFDVHKLSSRRVIKKLSRSRDLNGLAGALVDADSDLRVNVKTDFVSDFSQSIENGLGSVLPPVVLLLLPLVLGVIGGIVAGIRAKEAFSAFSSMLLTWSLAFPACSVVALCNSLFSANRKLKNRVAYITGYDSAADLSHAEFLLVDESEVFEAECVSMEVAEGVPLQHAVFCAYVLLSNEGGIFAQAVKDYLPTLMEKEAYEKLISREIRVDDFIQEGHGSSGWITDKKVFLGDREFLETHYIELPPVSDEMEGFYEQQNCIPLYLGIDRQYLGVLWFSLETEPGVSARLTEIFKKGVGLIMRRENDALTEELVASRLGAQKNFIKTVHGEAGAFVADDRDRTTSSERAGAVHHGRLLSMLELVASAFRLTDARRAVRLLTVVCSVILAVLGFVLSVMNAVARLNLPIALVVMLAAPVAGYLAGKLIAGK
ncbi:MAG: hypothetical protein K6C36_00500 [Clostridia bacterium]|nr:hypothetical protein [Clostridia bacterium]